MFRPSIGRIVHFYNTALASHENNGIGRGPYAAIITQVFGEPMTITDNPHVDLKVLTSSGDFYATSVRQQGGEDEADRPDDSRYYEEPPRVQPGIARTAGGPFAGGGAGSSFADVTARGGGGQGAPSATGGGGAGSPFPNAVPATGEAPKPDEQGKTEQQ